MKLQKARLARIQIAKATSGAAFVSKKKAAEAKMAARAAGLEVDENEKEDIFEMQHHHLLRCLEKTTVGECFESYLQYRFLQGRDDIESGTVKPFQFSWLQASL